MNKIKVYLASGWFTPITREIRNKLEKFLSEREDISLYSPMRDGIKLEENQKHDTALRESIFKENIKHIVDADLIVANIESTDPYNDPGTMYEIGFAMAHDIPVVGYCEHLDHIFERFKGIHSGFDSHCHSLKDLEIYLDGFKDVRSYQETNSKEKVLFVGSGNSEVDNKLVSYMMDSGVNIRWVNELHSEVYARIEEIFDNVKYLIVVIDDRKTIVSWMMGQAYSRGIPIITYSDFNYGINVMLLCSVLTHLRGTEELVRFLQQVKREGLGSIPKFDISQMDSM